MAEDSMSATDDDVDVRLLRAHLEGERIALVEMEGEYDELLKQADLENGEALEGEEEAVDDFEPRLRSLAERIEQQRSLVEDLEFNVAEEEVKLTGDNFASGITPPNGDSHEQNTPDTRSQQPRVSTDENGNDTCEKANHVVCDSETLDVFDTELNVFESKLSTFNSKLSELDSKLAQLYANGSASLSRNFNFSRNGNRPSSICLKRAANPKQSSLTPDAELKVREFASCFRIEGADQSAEIGALRHSFACLHVVSRDFAFQKLPLEVPIVQKRLDLTNYLTEICRHDITSACLDGALRAEPTRVSGYLRKLGGCLGIWRRRWFVFDYANRTLSYYADSDERRLKGSLRFGAIEDVYVDRVSACPRRSPSSRLTFCVRTPFKTQFLVAPSLELMRIWIDVILTACPSFVLRP